MATRTLLTVNEFLALPEREPDGTHYELSEGVLVTLSPSGYRHGAVVANVTSILRAALSRKEYIVASGEVGFILNSDSGRGTIRGADVAVNRRDSIGEPPAGFLAQAPFLAVEVVSPSNTATDLELKVAQYLNAGGREVWILYPETNKLYLYSDAGRTPRVFEGDEAFERALGCQFKVDLFFEI